MAEYTVTGKLDPEEKRLWVEALRSGEYKQGNGSLTSFDEDGSRTFCCLGVKGLVCHGYSPEELEKGLNLSTLRGSDELLLDISVTADEYWRSSVDAEQALVVMNDIKGRTFSEIADWIEEYL